MSHETSNAPHLEVRDTVECRRLGEPDFPWREWGPYVSERQWGTVREDYSADGDAWAYFPHDHARSRAYRWGEDGIAGFCDKHQKLCLTLALWNGKDPILKERLFGLTNFQGNHGEDVKELFYYVDGVPSHASMQMLYKYPQRAYPYEDLVRENGRRGLEDPEYEIVDTGIFDDGRYFDVEVEYAKASPCDILMVVRATNRGPEAAPLHIVPQLVARNTWSWGDASTKPTFAGVDDHTVAVTLPGEAGYRLVCEGAPTLLFCDNETNTRRLYHTEAQGSFKDAVNDTIVGGASGLVDASRRGTKVAAHYTVDLPPGGSATVRLRLTREGAPGSALSFEDTVALRRREADDYYAALQDRIVDADDRMIQRQALAGLLWSKQFYCFDVRHWLAGDPNQPPPPQNRRSGRDANWEHMAFFHVISMPDTWEYPWFAAWDLAFHCVTFALVDPGFAKSQIVLLTQAWSQHPNGQLPAYEWDFDDVNPPLQAWAALRIYEIDRQRSGVGDTVFLERVFHKLMLNFTWWVNQEDREGHNIFQGGFLGLDNIGPIDRSADLPGGAWIDQSDGTAWGAMYALSMLRIALELSLQNHVFEDLAIKFFEHFLYISGAMHGNEGSNSTGLWDDQDGFYYDVLRIPGQESFPLRVRSLVGLIPMLAVEVLHQDFTADLPNFAERMAWFLKNRPDLADLVSRWTEPNSAEFQLLALMRRSRMNRVLYKMLDEADFLSPFGIRSVSKYHEAHPDVYVHYGRTLEVPYTPGEGRTRMYGGNSNWRGPIWMPLNYLLIDALQKFFKFYGAEHQVEYPVGSGKTLSLDKVAAELTRRLLSLFRKGPDGRRPFRGGSKLENEDPHFADLLLFHEYFHAETGKGLGASHQTGWTALVALLLHPADETDATHVGPATVTNQTTTNKGTTQ